MHVPSFWIHDTWVSRLLSPLSRIAACVTARRVAKRGWIAPVPVICCGNATVGGAGKTTVTIALIELLLQREKAVHVLLRGYGGTARGPRKVEVGDPVKLVGDEALLLARYAPTWIGADRAASARAAIAAGAEVLLMDDGLQNPSLAKTLSLLIIDGTTGFGNGRVLPGGPLREPVIAAASRCHVGILIGNDETNAAKWLPTGFPVVSAHLEQTEAIEALIDKKVVAFAGIAIPNKFFAALRRSGIELVAQISFPDHHQFRAAELARLEEQANAQGAILVTTPKDAMRLPTKMKVHVVDVRVVWDNPADIELLLGQAVD